MLRAGRAGLLRVWGRDPQSIPRRRRKAGYVNSGMGPGQSPPRGSIGGHIFSLVGRRLDRPPTYIPPCVYPGSHPTGQEALPHAADGRAWGGMTPFPCVVYRVWAGPLIGPGCQPIRCSMVVKVTPCCSEGRVAELLRPSLRLTESPPRWVGLSLVLNSSLCYLRDQMEQLTHWPCLGWARGGWIETLFFFF